jgi:hypothetical protein
VRRIALLLAVVLVAFVACGDEKEENVPVAPAPPSRHDALRSALETDANAFAYEDGDWLEDLGDAPFYGLAWLSRRNDPHREAAAGRAKTLLAGQLLDGDLQDKVMAALGLIEHMDASGDRDGIEVLDGFVDRLDSLTRTLGDYLEAGADRSWAIRIYGPTAVTALVALVEAQYALFIGGDRRDQRLERAIAIEKKIAERAHGDLADAATGRTARAFAIAPGNPKLDLYANVAMMLLEARLFRLTRDELYRVQARALYVAIQPLKLSDAPARYASLYAAESLKAQTREVATLSSQNYLALALALMFEITGQSKFIEEADRVLDGIEAMRGPWCVKQVREAPEDRCTTGLLHHVVDGRLALPGDGTLFCSGCNLQTLYVLGYRRMLAGQAW